ncbi:Uncharacterized protein, PA2063/DUF2235 family [Lysobacter sp. yr284]|uniref:phospholipase effector Tle1 domain-containing protein n=1 Tax=Lysobacter TaxID=68 RepID=UPI00089882EF|nr:DUF2235 domain-containing protein [Lysobacter sp. yr284]SDZ22933.1 Uncharacterized protein, PA2063/DUF2235 family [Lysobacter sp. yr284]
MPKTILIFADGTGQAGGVRPDQQLSNIYKLFRATRVGPDSAIDPKRQVAFYDPGLGTATAAGGVRLNLWQRLRSLAGLAFGLGFSRNVVDCYEAILKRYEPGDRVFLFGFSRGGYTVRCVANVLNLCGVPTGDGRGGPLPRAGRALRAIAEEAVTRVYEHGAGHPRERFEFQREAIARRFRRKYAAGEHPDHGEVYPEFVGVFDAVAALGLPLPARMLLILAGLLVSVLAAIAIGAASESWLGGGGWIAFAATLATLGLGVAAAYLKATLRYASADVRGDGPRFHLALWNSEHYDRLLDRRIPQVRHALAIDENRRQFGRVTWGGGSNRQQVEQCRFKQRWFAGNHSDIGGSYPEDESRLSDIALAWMVDELEELQPPIQLDRSKLQLYPDACGLQHCEIFAQRQRYPFLSRIAGWPSATRGPGPDLDPTVLQRLQAHSVTICDRRTAYRPDALRRHREFAAYYPDPADAPPAPPAPPQT